MIPTVADYTVFGGIVAFVALIIFALVWWK